jgi:hypothetical protein
MLCRLKISEENTKMYPREGVVRIGGEWNWFRFISSGGFY